MRIKAAPSPSAQQVRTATKLLGRLRALNRRALLILQKFRWGESVTAFRDSVDEAATRMNFQSQVLLCTLMMGEQPHDLRIEVRVGEIKPGDEDGRNGDRNQDAGELLKFPQPQTEHVEEVESLLFLLCGVEEHCSKMLGVQRTPRKNLTLVLSRLAMALSRQQTLLHRMGAESGVEIAVILEDYDEAELERMYALTQGGVESDNSEIP